VKEPDVSTAFDPKLAELRRSFDESFVRPPPEALSDSVDLIGIRLGPDPFAIPTGEIGGIAMCGKLVTVPSSNPRLLGLVGIRGVVIPVFGLAALLGYASLTAPVRWLALTAGAEPIALAFEELEGHLRLPSSSIHADSSDRAANECIERAAVDGGGLVRAVISIPLVVAAIRNRSGLARSEKEA
jgi:chemotaxis signal transduction protein